MLSTSRTLNLLSKGTVSLLGLFSIATIAVAPANADNASASAAVVSISPAGYVTSIAAEKVAPNGYYFDKALTVTPTYDPTTQAVTLLVFDAGTMATTAATAPSTDTLRANVITELNALDTATRAGLDAYAAILKAAAGANGLE